jgi:excisionase family DNA binding protein
MADQTKKNEVGGDAPLTYDEAARYLGVPKGTLYSLVSTQRIPHVRMGRRLVRFRKADLEAWLAAHRVEEL